MKWTMNALLIDRPTFGRDVTLTEVQIPEPMPGWVLVRVRGFGMNHSELILRTSEIREGYIKKPVIPGIECVGEVVDSIDGCFDAGDRVIAMMGGMGRSFDGSYAEYALLPAHHVFRVDTDMPWDELAAVPETYYTAWGSLFDSLHIMEGDRLLIRGATCALGHAAIQIAEVIGCEVTATTHRESRLMELEEADSSILDDGNLDTGRFDKALELVGPSTLLDTMRHMDPGGIVCSSGILGGECTLDGFDPIKGIPNGVYLTGFFSNFPDSDAVNKMMNFIDSNSLKPRIAARFPFQRLKEACILQELGGTNGKIVVTMD